MPFGGRSSEIVSLPWQEQEQEQEQQQRMLFVSRQLQTWRQFGVYLTNIESMQNLYFKSFPNENNNT
jgi:hypothetical protein